MDKRYEFGGKRPYFKRHCRAFTLLVLWGEIHRR